MRERITGFLFSPSTTFDASKGDTLGDALKYFVIIMAIYAIFIAIIATVTFSLLAGMLELFGAPIAMPFGAALGPAAAIIFFSAALISGIIGSFITGLWLHLWVYLVGGRKGLEKTIIALLYGQTPYLLLGWIPIINFIALLWTIIVEIIGVRQLHELTTGKAVIAVILALIIPLIVFGVLFAVFFMPLMHGPVGYGPSIVPRMGGSL